MTTMSKNLLESILKKNWPLRLHSSWRTQSEKMLVNQYKISLSKKWLWECSLVIISIPPFTVLSRWTYLKRTETTNLMHAWLEMTLLRWLVDSAMSKLMMSRARKNGTMKVHSRLIKMLSKTFTKSTRTRECWQDALLSTSSYLYKSCKPVQELLLALVKVLMMLPHWRKQMLVSAWALAAKLQRTLHRFFSLTITSGQSISLPCGEETWLMEFVSSSSSS